MECVVRRMLCGGGELSGGEYGREYLAAAGGERGVMPLQSCSSVALLDDALKLSTGGILVFGLVSFAGWKRTARAHEKKRTATEAETHKVMWLR